MCQPVKRARLSILEQGRSASDPPFSLARRSAKAMSIPMEQPLGLAPFPPAPRTDLPKALRSIQSAPPR